jgi:hypothetical protein
MSNNEQQSKLQIEEVRVRLAPWLFKGFQSNWLEPPSERERWLIAGLRRPVIYRLAPERQAALERDEFRTHLLAKINEWLGDHGVDVYEDDDGCWVDRYQFERAYAEAFPKLAPIDEVKVIGWMEKEAGQRWVSGPRPRGRDIVIAAMSQFPNLSERQARACYTKVRKDLKKRGPLPAS